MASEIDICNSALIKLGAATIISLIDDDPKATALSVRYPLVRDAELRRRLWRFSICRVSLPALATPIDGYAYAYQMPTEPPCLRLLNVGAFHAGLDQSDYRGSSDAYYSVENGKILTGFGAPLPVRYIGQITDTGLFDAAFNEALASRLAYELCYKITQSSEKEDRCMRDYRMAISEATRANALENPPEHIADDSWIVARL